MFMTMYTMLIIFNLLAALISMVYLGVCILTLHKKVLRVHQRVKDMYVKAENFLVLSFVLSFWMAFQFVNTLIFHTTLGISWLLWDLAVLAFFIYFATFVVECLTSKR